jgi:hypothetical protein
MNLPVESPLNPALAIPASPPQAALGLLPPGTLEAEERFYGEYSWCLNPWLTVREAVERLSGELARLDAPMESWQRTEVMTNVYLLACALLNSADDYLRGSVYRLPHRLAALPFSRLALKAAQKVIAWKRARRVRRAASWHDRAVAALDPFLQLYISALTAGASIPAGAAGALAEVLRTSLPVDLQAEYTQIPSAFRKQDLTPLDVLGLGRQFIARFPDRCQPILAVGMRTAGTYFAPLFRALLRTEGYETVDLLTIRPAKGLGAKEQAALEHWNAMGHHAVLLDDPPTSGNTIAQAVDLLHRAGFPGDRLTVLFPVHRLRRNRNAHLESVSLMSRVILTLEPEQWHKNSLLEPGNVERRLAEYFQNHGYVRSQVIIPSPSADAFNAQLEAMWDEKYRNRLKRVYQVRLDTADGSVETRFVLAKSVGWGYLSYHAFHAGSRLSRFVPPLLGLRDGLLYTEWIPQKVTSGWTGAERKRGIDALASYAAARVRHLRLPNGLASAVGLNKQHEGFNLLANILSQAYGSAAASRLMRSRVRRRLAGHVCPVPTWIDAKMRASEWLANDAALLKADFEHHGLGKNELNVVDPAYDLAETILQFALSSEEEDHLLARYRKDSGDTTVQRRLFLFKLLTGLWNMNEAMRNFGEQHLTHRQAEFHREYVRAWNFLTVQTARHCGRFCPPSLRPGWRSPLVVLDVDGVVDRRIFGFPCTSTAGIQALSLLHAHDFSIALNTARSATEVQEYCKAYACAGAVAEYGSFVWDAVRERGRVLVGAEALRQLERARQALARLSGVFVNESYEYSIRACTYPEGFPLPVPTPLIERLFAELNLDQLSSHQTTIDSTIIARDVNKGTGLTALLAWVGLAGAATVAVGDSDQDLPMFRVAGRSFAPANISCARSARFFGCAIAPHPFQRGLLHIVQSLVHPGGDRCRRCGVSDSVGNEGQDLFMDVLRAADEKRSHLLVRALLHPAVLDVFVR